jgi:hypothetical protein
MNLFGFLIFPFLALLVALAALGLRDIVFGIDVRSWIRVMRGLAFLAAPVAMALLCLLAFMLSPVLSVD